MKVLHYPFLDIFAKKTFFAKKQFLLPVSDALRKTFLNVKCIKHPQDALLLKPTPQFNERGTYSGLYLFLLVHYE